MSDVKIYTGERFSCAGIEERELQKFDLTSDNEMAIRVICEEIEKDKKNSPKITTYNIIDTNEHAHVFQSDVKEFRVRAKQSARMNVSYTVNTTNDGDNNWHIGLGGVYEEANLKSPNALTLYFRLDRSNREIQVLEWT